MGRAHGPCICGLNLFDVTVDFVVQSMYSCFATKVSVPLDHLNPIATGHDYRSVGKVSMMVSMLDQLDPSAKKD